ncbi:MAG: Hrp-dependent type III effector protein [Alphaproteobacteria bacterium]|nr:MAG: Hrp-dependent type III effector protein [Alphaproteobacteria bacterium]
MIQHSLNFNQAYQPFLGCIADDVTGATDLSLNLVQGGMEVVQWLKIPTLEQLQSVYADAAVVALKIRSIQANEAVEQALSALQILEAAGCQRYYFKYCSTFDSTEQGNIAPIAEALLDALSSDQTIFCPAFPEAGRTVYTGHLFVNDQLLNESGMQNHPLNPMNDANLIRVLSKQSTRKVGLLHLRDIELGPDNIQQKLRSLKENGCTFVIVDTLGNQHLGQLATACADFKLITGGSGLARFLAGAYQSKQLVDGKETPIDTTSKIGRSAVLSGSCSTATLQQVDNFKEYCVFYQIDIPQLMQNEQQATEHILDWVNKQPIDQPLMIYSSDEHKNVNVLQQQYGSENVANKVECLQARLAKSLVDNFGVKKLIVAGGETSSAVAAALDIQALRIGAEIAPGVPWTESISDQPINLAFKSGNFGDEKFFQTALEMLQ